MNAAASPNETEAVRDVLRQWRGVVSPYWRITCLGRGGQATIFRVTATRGGCVAPGIAEVVIKLYRVLPADFDVAAEEEAALAQLHAAVDGRHVAGWRLATPRPLWRSSEPVALVSTRAPGRPLAHELRGENRRIIAELDSVAAAMLGGLEAYWAPRTRIYGDLSFDNVLIDVRQRTLSFVDPGVDEPDTWFADVPRRCYPASRDLGYALFNAAASLRPHLLRPRVWRRRLRLSQELLTLYCARVPRHERRHLIQEAQATCDVLLRRIKTTGLSPASVWRRVVRCVAAHAVRRALAGVQAEHDKVEMVHGRSLEGGLA